MTHRPAPADAAALIRGFISAPEEAAWIALLEVHAQVTRALDRALIVGHDLPVRSFDLLMRIAHDPAGETTITELADGAAVSQSQVSRIVIELERRGLVERRSKAGDGRATAVAMTDAGFAALAAAAPAYLGTLRERLFDHLGAGDAEQLGTILAQALDAQPSPEAPAPRGR